MAQLRRFFAARLWSALCPLLLLVAACPSAAEARTEGSKTATLHKEGNIAKGLGAAPSDIITVTTENYAQTIKQGTWFVKFYTDWCAHCQKLQPTWEEIATELKGKVNVGQVNCDNERALCKRFQVRGYPTLVHIDNRKCRVYQKSRDVDALLAFAVRGYMTAPAVSALKSPFGPIEDFKAALLEASISTKDFVVEQIESGTPLWVVCLAAVAVLVVVTVIVALVMVATKRPKQE